MKQTNKLLPLFFIVCLSVISFSCTTKTESNDSMVSIDVEEDHILDNQVLTKEEQQNLTPAMVLAILKQGNQDFVNDDLTIRNNTDRVRQAALQQYPKAVVLSCLDSRVPVEDVFHRGIGDIFVARVAGNIVNEDILGSMEYACEVSGSKLIVVLGHEYCGAIKSAIEDVQLGNITSLLAKIQPAVAKAKTTFAGSHSAKDAGFVEAVCHHNVEIMIENIRAMSPILKESEEKGEIMIVGAVYDMETGRVDFM